MILDVNRVSKSFGGLQALFNVDIAIKRGSIVGVIGPNGAGKTTLFNCISGSYKPNSGSIKFKDEEIVGLQPHQVCQRGLTRTYQIPRLFPELTVLENVMVGTWLKAKKVAEARERAHDIFEFLGFKGNPNMPAKKLMAADSKRIEIAKVLAIEPELLLLDEAMAGLNAVETEEAIEIIRKISSKGITIVIVEHVLRVVMTLCEYVFVVHEGRKLAEGIPQKIISNPDVINAYLGEGYEDAGS